VDRVGHVESWSVPVIGEVELWTAAGLGTAGGGGSSGHNDRGGGWLAEDRQLSAEQTRSGMGLPARYRRRAAPGPSSMVESVVGGFNADSKDGRSTGIRLEGDGLAEAMTSRLQDDAVLSEDDHGLGSQFRSPPTSGPPLPADAS